MVSKNDSFSSKQRIFQEIFVGTLIYSAVLGFFNDYTNIVYARSFSTIFFASVVLEILTYLTFRLKDYIIYWLKDHKGKLYRALTFFCVWLVMFFSKFIFIGALDMVFGSYIKIEGFFGILLLVVCVTIIHKLAYKIFKALS